MATKKPKTPLSIEALKHEEATRKNIPTAEYQAVLAKAEQAPVRVAMERRNRDLDPQLVWRGKEAQDEADLVVQAAPLYIQEKVHPKVLVDDLRRESDARREARAQQQPDATIDLFADFNGLPNEAARTEFYQHDAHWANRFILGDSLQVMASLAEREGLRGKVQCIYFDPPYGIKFNSNFQWSTTSRDVKDGNAEHITREPEQVKAFRDIWRDGIHSYLSYLRDRLTVARDLLTESGSIFVQIGDENVHRVRAVMDEVFGDDNCVTVISFKKTGSLTDKTVASVCDYLVWYAKSLSDLKSRQILVQRDGTETASFRYYWDTDGTVLTDAQAKRTGAATSSRRLAQSVSLSSQHESKTRSGEYKFAGKSYKPPTNRQWSVDYDGLTRLCRSSRIFSVGENLRYAYLLDDNPSQPTSNLWTDGGAGSFTEDQTYVVQTATKIVQRCLHMASDPGDLILDPTCGSGTTAYVAEQWGRRWITIDTSRVALALARARIMGARYPYYLLADSKDGQLKEAEVSRSVPKSAPTYGNIGLGFVYERVPHITLKSIANNAEIDVIWDKYEAELAPLRKQLSAALPNGWLAAYRKQQKYTAEVPAEIAEWEVPRETPAAWSKAAKELVAQFWKLRIARQQEIDASIAAKADSEFLYDKPYTDRKKVRVAGPFTVESLSPHRVLGVDENDELIDTVAEAQTEYGRDFNAIILENLRTAGVQQAHKDGKIDFTALTPWPGELICAEGRFSSDQWSVAGGQGSSERNQPTTDHRSLATEKRAAIFIGPEFGTVTRVDLAAAAREAAEADFDVLIACAFSFDAHASELAKLGRIRVLQARMNADLHMAEDLKNTGKGNLFVIFGEPDITVASGQWLVTRNGRMVANYEQAKELSGLGSLEEINRAGRDRDIPDPGSTIGDRDGGAMQPGAGTGGGSRSDAQRTQALAALHSLSDADFPLSLTTDHWSQVTVHGVDVFHPNSGEIRSDGADGIACWFIDTDYNEESFFVRQAYFLGANDPYKALKTTLKAEIDAEAWASLNSDTSRPFDKPKSGRIAVKVINHLGDEVMKVFRV